MDCKFSADFSCRDYGISQKSEPNQVDNRWPGGAHCIAAIAEEENVANTRTREEWNKPAFTVYWRRGFNGATFGHSSKRYF